MGAASNSYAADVVVDEVVVVVEEAFSWSGVYVGVHGGRLTAESFLAPAEERLSPGMASRMVFSWVRMPAPSINPTTIWSSARNSTSTTAKWRTLLLSTSMGFRDSI